MGHPLADDDVEDIEAEARRLRGSWTQSNIQINVIFLIIQIFKSVMYYIKILSVASKFLLIYNFTVVTSMKLKLYRISTNLHMSTRRW